MRRIYWSPGGRKTLKKAEKKGLGIFAEVKVSVSCYGWSFFSNTRAKCFPFPGLVSWNAWKWQRQSLSLTFTRVLDKSVGRGQASQRHTATICWLLCGDFSVEKTICRNSFGNAGPNIRGERRLKPCWPGLEPWFRVPPFVGFVSQMAWYSKFLDFNKAGTLFILLEKRPVLLCSKVNLPSGEW